MELPGIVKMGRTAIIVALFGSIILNFIGAVIVGLSTNDWVPALDSSVGLVVNADNHAYEGIRSITTGTALSQVPPELRRTYFDYLRWKILLSIAFEVIAIGLLWKLLVKLQGDLAQPATKVLMLVLAIVIYIVIGVMYVLLKLVLIHGDAGLDINRETLISFAPFKSIWYSVWHIDAIFPSTPELISLAKNNSVNQNITLIAGGLNVSA